MPVYRPAASSILRSFRASGKRHLLLTGRARAAAKQRCCAHLCHPSAPMPRCFSPLPSRADGSRCAIQPPGQRRSSAGLMPPCPPVKTGCAPCRPALPPWGCPPCSGWRAAGRLGRAGRAWLSGERLRGFSTKRAGYVESLPRSRGGPQAGHPIPARALRRPGRLCVRSGPSCAAAGLHRHGLGAGAAVRRQQADGRAERAGRWLPMRWRWPPRRCLPGALL